MVELVATCLFGLEGLVGEEIDALGYERISTTDGRVLFRGDVSAIARSNIFLRCAERVLIHMGSFRAETFDELFEGTKALGWTGWIGCDDAFPVTGHSVKSRLTSIPDCQKIVKKAIVESMKPEYGIAVFPEDGVKCRVEFLILNDTASLMIDTSGAPLFKRGYRTEASVAPIRETLAAAMAKLARPRENVLFWDPMCGSGTIPIEAAMIMTNTAPGMSRSFAAEEFYDIPDSAWKNARDEARSAIVKTDFEAYASDIDPDCVKLTQENIRRAGMEANIKAFCRDALEISSEGRRGTIVFNPPYGERLMTQSEAERLYCDMGKALSAEQFAKWQLYVITPCENFERLFGRRADKKRKLYNGMIKCTYYQFFKSAGEKRTGSY